MGLEVPSERVLIILRQTPSLDQIIGMGLSIAVVFPHGGDLGKPLPVVAESLGKLGEIGLSLLLWPVHRGFGAAAMEAQPVVARGQWRGGGVAQELGACILHFLETRALEVLRPPDLHKVIVICEENCLLLLPGEFVDLLMGQLSSGRTVSVLPFTKEADFCRNGWRRRLLRLLNTVRHFHRLEFLYDRVDALV
ncbi:hypothetical protein BP00DRAFT_467365 [Aspergillus indologenus CBS 114.80]|uniref:Uncharacterized protein n=1 Tax=Aspergillus indologenus CBS 114.80 TaxID=1450541 RepID=A0A2V5HNC4_9EURO|nr:hypothetical protein BP00DRAFT_467365 [Aspergillus indologenus CBS 114.80]